MQVNDQPELRSETTDPSVLDLTERVDAVERLIASERRYRALIDTTSDGIFLFEADGAIRSINRSGERLFGRTAEQMDHVRAEDFSTPTTWPRSPRRSNRSLQRLEMMHDIDCAILEGRSTGEMARRVVE